MFLFLKLVLAHLIADFVLQFEELYQLKVRSVWGHIFHVLIHGLVSLLLLFPYLDRPFIWFFVTGMVLMHLVQDFIKYTLTRKIPKNTFFYFMADQFVHLLVLSAILLFPVSAEVRGFPDHALLNGIYTNNLFTLGFIFFILLTFSGSYAFHAFCRSYLKGSRADRGITSFEMAYTILERSLISATVLGIPLMGWLLLTPLVGLARLPFPKMRDLPGFLFSLFYAIGLGLLFRSFL